MSKNKVMAIVTYFHIVQYRDIKHYYSFHVCRNMRYEFSRLVSYNLLMELMQSTLLPLVIFCKTQCLGECIGISFIDSTQIRAYHLKREHSYKILIGLTTKIYCSIRWFFRLKMHFIINDQGELLDFIFSPRNVDNRNPLSGTNLLAKIYRKLFADRGYISQYLFKKSFIDGIHKITKLRKKMKNSLMRISDKILLRKRALVETVCDELKNICQIEHTGHRSQEKFIVNLISGLIAYCYLLKKHTLNLEIVDQSMALSF